MIKPLSQILCYIIDARDNVRYDDDDDLNQFSEHYHRSKEKQSKRAQSNQWKITQTLFIDERLRWWIIRKKTSLRAYWNKFSREKVELKVTKNKRASRKQCCGVSMPKKSALINARMIEKWNYLYLFIILVADVIKYLCLSFSRFVLDSALASHCPATRLDESL